MANKKLNRNYPNIIGSPASLQGTMQMRYGSINQFKPYIAVYVYQKFKPKRVLDTSAGWGDRCVAAMSQNIDYIGIDTNKKLMPAYKRMIKDFSSSSTSSVKMIFKKSETVDYSKLEPYDMIFTSPPYFSVEQYEGMKKYKDDSEFINKFFLPTIKNAFRNLQRGGVMALNMPMDMYAVLKEIYGVSKKIKMPIQNRYHDGKKKYEYIHYWIKS